MSFNNSNSFSFAPFDLIHYDIWGPAPIPTEGGSKYFVIFVYDFSRYTWIYLLHYRFELVSIYQILHKMIETQFNRTVKVFRSNNAQEYNDKSFLSFLDSHGTLLQRSCPYTSQQNGRAEQKHRHILDVVCTLLISAYLPECFWGEAALTAVYTINRIPSPTTHNKSPFKLLYGQTPDYSSLRVLVMLVLSLFLLMNEQSSSLVLVSVVSLVMLYLKRGFAAMIPFLIAFVCPIMLSFGNIILSRVFSSFPCSLPQSLPFLLNFSSLYILNLWRIFQHRLPLQTTHLRFDPRHITRLSWILWHHPLLSLLLVLNFIVPLR